jgi:CelD/BcsL family acetyltransferase involved in cellulose biosynthesis
LDCRLVDSFDQLERYDRDWDRLAVACGKPTCRPAWLRAWWNASCVPADRESRALRVVVVTEGTRLVGLFPAFLIDRDSRFPDLNLLGAANFWSVEPLVSADASRETFASFARALGESSPTPARLVLRWVPAQANWPQELRCHWPGRPATLRRSQRAKLLLVEGPTSYETWLATLPRHRRAELLRLERRRAQAGLEVRCTDTPSAIGPDVHALFRHARAKWRSPWLNQSLENMIVEAGRSLVSSGDFRLWKVVRGEELIAGALFARAGEASEALFTAFDPAWSRLGPGLGAFTAAIRGDLDTGVRVIDFGFAQYRYLQRLSNAERPIVRYELFPTDLRMPLARARWLRAHTRERVDSWRGQLQIRTRLRTVRERNARLRRR